MSPHSSSFNLFGVIVGEVNCLTLIVEILALALIFLSHLLHLKQLQLLYIFYWDQFLIYFFVDLVIFFIEWLNYVKKLLQFFALSISKIVYWVFRFIESKFLVNDHFQWSFLHSCTRSFVSAFCLSMNCWFFFGKISNDHQFFFHSLNSIFLFNLKDIFSLQHVEISCNLTFFVTIWLLFTFLLDHFGDCIPKVLSLFAVSIAVSWRLRFFSFGILSESFSQWSISPLLLSFLVGNFHVFFD